MISRLTYLSIGILSMGLCLSAIPHYSLGSQPIANLASVPALPQVDLNQTVNLKLAFLGVPQELVNQTSLLSLLPQTIDQFQYPDPDTITWNLNYSFLFNPFPQNVSDSLLNSAFHSEGSTYFNVTLLDNLLSQELTIPTRGYLLAFMWIPNSTGHSWFCVQDRPDLFFNITYYSGGNVAKPWVCSGYFGGLDRALYFDISQVMEEAPTEFLLTMNVYNLISNSLRDVFPDLMGLGDPRWVEADVQTYRNYTVRILWLNGTGQQLPLEVVRKGLEDLMPWTNWTVTVETEAADNSLNSLVENRTKQLTNPSNYTVVLPNGTKITFEARKSLDWTWTEDDPINSYLINHVKDYFNLTDQDDKSVIPVILLQLANDTASLGGLSLFPDDLILLGAQGTFLTDSSGLGQAEWMYILRHEIGHWVGIAHHSPHTSHSATILCSMVPEGPAYEAGFCAFCKDARARMSFMSYYGQTATLLSNNQTKREALESEINDSLQLFYNWNYTEAVTEIASIYSGLDTTPPTIINVTQTPPQDVVQPQDAVAVNATVVDDLSGVKKVVLNYSSQVGTWNTIDMTNIEGSIWNATIPAFPLGTNVTYNIIAKDNFNNVITSQEIGLNYQYHVISEYSQYLALAILIAATLLAAIGCRSLLSKAQKETISRARATRNY